MPNESGSYLRVTASASFTTSWRSSRRKTSLPPDSRRARWPSFGSLPRGHQNNTDHDQRNSSTQFHALHMPQTFPELARRPEDPHVTNRIHTRQHAGEKSNRIGDAFFLFRRHRHVELSSRRFAGNVRLQERFPRNMESSGEPTDVFRRTLALSVQNL